MLNHVIFKNYSFQSITLSHMPHFDALSIYMKITLKRTIFLYATHTVWTSTHSGQVKTLKHTFDHVQLIKKQKKLTNTDKNQILPTNSQTHFSLYSFFFFRAIKRIKRELELNPKIRNPRN